MQKLISYLQSIQAIVNVRELERLAGTPKMTIHNALAGHQGLPQKWAGPILRVLCQHFGSVVIDGWTIVPDEEVSTIYILSRPIPDREPESREIEEPGGTAVHFEYYVPQYRAVYDEFDLITHILS